MNEVDVSLADVEPPSWLEEYRCTCRSILGAIGVRDFELSVVLMDGDGIRRLNRQYRNLDRETDVLSFSQRQERHSASNGDRRAEGPETLGDVVVCPSVVEAHAMEFAIPFRDELHRVTIHGVLHLLGMDHDGDDRMLKYQEELLTRVNKERIDR